MIQCAAVAIALAVGQTDPDEIERAVYRSRAGVKSGLLTIHSDYKQYGTGVSVQLLRKIWFDQERLRIDKIGIGKDIREVGCSNCERPDHYVYYRDPPKLKGVFSLYLA